MTLYGGIDLHAKNSLMALLDDHDKIVFEKSVHNARSPGVHLHREQRTDVLFTPAAECMYKSCSGSSHVTAGTVEVECTLDGAVMHLFETLLPAHSGLLSGSLLYGGGAAVTTRSVASR
jgi:hypothetical protein